MNIENENNETTNNSNLICEICFKHDEFSICNICYNNYAERLTNFRNSIKSEKYHLRSCIDDIIRNNYKKIEFAGKASQKILKLDTLNKKMNDLHSLIKMKKNMNIVLEEKINEKKGNIKIIKEVIDRQKINSKNIKEEIRRNEEISKGDKKISDEIKNWFMNFLVSNVFLNSVDIQIEDYLEIHEYVNLKPGLNEINNKILSQESNNLSNDMKDFEKISNVLSVSSSENLINFNSKEYDMNYDKFIKFKSKILSNRFSIYTWNNFINNLIFFQKRLSQFLDIPLPYILDEVDAFKIKNLYNDSKLSLYLDSTQINTHNENYLSELIQGYIYLDYNLKFLFDYIKGDNQYSAREVRKYKNGFTYESAHALITHAYAHDLSNFLNIKKLVPFEILNKIKAKPIPFTDSIMPEVVVNEMEVEIQIERKFKEEDGFVFIENFYVKN